MLTSGYHDIINAKLIPDSITQKITQAFNSTNTEARRLLNSKHRIKIAVIALASSVTGFVVITTLGLIVLWRRVPKSIKNKLTALKYMIFFNGPIRTAIELFYPTLCLSLITIMHND